MIDLEALAALREKATPGPWRFDPEKHNRDDGPDCGSITTAEDDPWYIATIEDLGPHPAADAALIAAAVNAVGPLCEEVKRLRGALEEIRSTLDNPPGITFEQFARLNVKAWKVARAALDGGGE